MKRLFETRFPGAAALCLSVGLLFGIAGCSSAVPDSAVLAPSATSAGDTQQAQTARLAYELYQTAEENRRMQASLDATMKGSVNIACEGKETAMTLSVDTKLAGSPDSPQVYTLFSMTDGTNASAYTAYYLDGKRYYSDGTQQYFESASAELATHEAAKMDPVSMTAAAFENAAITEKDGLSTVSMTVKGDILVDTLLADDGLLASLLGYAPDADAEGTVLSDVQVSFTVNENGYLTEHRIAYSLTESVQGIPTDVRLELHVTVHQPGQPVTIEFPDFSAYTSKAAAGNSLEQDNLDALAAVLDQLYDDSGMPVSDFDSRYQKLCEQYGKEALDAAIAWYQDYLKDTAPLGAG